MKTNQLQPKTLQNKKIVQSPKTTYNQHHQLIHYKYHQLIS